MSAFELAEELAALRPSSAELPLGEAQAWPRATPHENEYAAARALEKKTGTDSSEPVHVHGKFQGRESRAELILVDGLVTEIRYGDVTGRAPLGQAEMRYFEEIVSARAAEIVTKWIDFFVLHKPIKPEHIARRLK